MFWMVVFMMYSGLVFWLFIGWKKVVNAEGESSKSTDFVSVIVPMRNESPNIQKLIQSIFDQDIGKNQFELLIVDDHSTDDSMDVAEKKIQELKFENAFILRSKGFGKKSAIHFGVENSKGSVILVTDADCIHQSGWIKSMNSKFQYADIKMVCGAVKLEAHEKSLFGKMQAQEFSSLIGSGAATLAWGIPTMCNGANLAFKKEAFYQVGGYSSNLNCPSGDDEFLLRAIYKMHPSGVIFNSAQNAIVITSPLSSLTGFMEQRIRWAGKWKFHKDIITRLLPLFLIAFYGSLLSLPLAVSFKWITMNELIILVLLKVILEFLFLYSVGRWLKQKWSWLSFFAWQFVYPFYALLIGLLSNVKSYKWKGRSYEQMLKTA